MRSLGTSFHKVITANALHLIRGHRFLPSPLFRIQQACNFQHATNAVISASTSQSTRNTKIGRLHQKILQRIKKAPGKYVVLGGRRTTRLKSREPVDWSPK